MPCTHLKLYQYKSNKGAYKKCVVGKNSLGKGGLNAKAGFCYPYNNRYISFLPCVMNTEIMRLIDADELKNRIHNGYVCLIPDPETEKNH